MSARELTGCSDGLENNLGIDFVDTFFTKAQLVNEVSGLGESKCISENMSVLYSNVVTRLELRCEVCDRLYEESKSDFEEI